MVRRVTRIAPWQAGKFFAVLYFIFGLIFAISVRRSLRQFRCRSRPGSASGFAIAFPFIYAIGALIFVPLRLPDLQLRAKLVGGLDFEVVDHDAILPESRARPAGFKPAGRRSRGRRGCARRNDA